MLGRTRACQHRIQSKLRNNHNSCNSCKLHYRLSNFRIITVLATLPSSSSHQKAAQCDVKIFAGDFVQGTVYDTVFREKIAIDAMNFIGYDIATFGNHEFNKGPEPVYNTVLCTPNITWLASNMKFLAAPAGFKVNSTTVVGNICWVAAVTEATAEISSPGPDIIFRNAIVSLNKAIAKCPFANAVAAVTHIGFDQDVAVCNAIRGLSLVIGGHSHTDVRNGRYPTRVQRADGSVCWVVTALAFSRYLGMMDISSNANGDLDVTGYAYYPLDYRVPEDPEAAALVEEYTKLLDESVSEVVGFAAEPIDGERESCRAVECEMGNLVCDSMLDYAGPKQGAVACIHNGGSVRASINQGNITVSEVLTVLPFSNVHVVLTVPGETLLSALEFGFGAIGDEEVSGRFPQVGGMVVDVDYGAIVGQRVRNVTVAGVPLQEEALYTIVTNIFLANGGDGYEWPGAMDVQLSGIGLDTLLSDYLTDNSPYTPFIEGRINDVSGSSVSQRFAHHRYELKRRV